MSDPTCGAFEVGEFLTRGHCGGWLPAMRLLYEGSSTAIFATYVIIAAVLGYAVLWERKAGVRPESLPARERGLVQSVYAVFILACGLGHLEGLVTFYHADYHFWAVWHSITALASWRAVFTTVRYRLNLAMAL